MTESEFIAIIENVTESGPGKVSPEMALSEVPGWDSLAVVGLIATLDSLHGLRVNASSLAQCKTVRDLITLLGDNVTA